MLETVRLSGATDPEGDPILMPINAVSQDEAVTGTGIGDPTFPDAHFTAAGADRLHLHRRSRGELRGRLHRGGPACPDPAGGRLGAT